MTIAPTALLAIAQAVPSASSSSVMTAVLTGFGTGLGLIVAIGAQNAWVLRQGVRREHIGLVIAICALSDLVLITVGTGAIRIVTGLAPWVLEVLRWGGVVYLAVFAVSSFRSALRPGALEQSAARPAASVAATTLALTWLNPHVYLDTVLMLGTVTNDFGPARWWAAAGACAASAWKVTDWHPASAYCGAHLSGSSIMRCASTGRIPVLTTASATGSPQERFGTKWLSMTSTCATSAPEIFSSSPRRSAMSQLRIDGEIVAFIT